MAVRTLVLVAVALLCSDLTGCVTQAPRVHPVTLPSGQAGYVILCNSSRYDRCLNRAARACGGAYTLWPQDRSTTVRIEDSTSGAGSSESITVRCDTAPVIVGTSAALPK